MTSQGTASGRFTRAIQRRDLFQAELSLREMGTPSLLVAELKEKLGSAAIRLARTARDPSAGRASALETRVRSTSIETRGWKVAMRERP